jgi:hypothetical protein
MRAEVFGLQIVALIVGALLYHFWMMMKARKG